MSANQLWSPAPQRPAQNTAENLEVVRPDMIPGTWLQLSSSSNNNFLPLSPMAAALPSNTTEAVQELALPSKFLSNQGPPSRASSFSSTSSVQRPVHPALGQKTNYGLNIERREMAVARAGGITSAYATHH